MKSILLASASLVGFASVAAAEVTFSGSANVGYNDDIKGGVFWEGDLTVTLTQELNNGLTAGGSFGLNITQTDDGKGAVVESGDWVVSLTSETAGMYFGNTDNATETLWSGIDGMEADGFDEDNKISGDGSESDMVLRGELTFGSITADVSSVVDADNELSGMQFAADASFGAFNVGVAYQDDSFDSGEILGLSAGGTFGAASVALAYAQNETEDSIGVSIGYPVGPVSLSAYFATNSESGDNYGIGASYASGAITVDAGYDFDASDDEGLFDVEATYDVGNGLKLWAGVLDIGHSVNDPTFYTAGTLDLGGGASLLVSYVEDNDGESSDDVGAPELNDGTTVKVSFSF